MADSLNKSQGSDILLVNFFPQFWYSIGQLVADALNTVYCRLELSPEQSRDIITLLPKPGKDKTFLKILVQSPCKIRTVKFVPNALQIE